MQTPQVFNYPEAVAVFSRHNCDAWFEPEGGAGWLNLKIKELDNHNRISQLQYHVSQIPDPSDKEACKQFWDNIWRDTGLYPQHIPTYAIPSAVDWISIDEHKPDDKQPVLVYGELRGTGQRPHVATYRVGYDAYNPYWFEYTTPDRGNIPLEGVTHWLPIPNDPPRRSQY